MKTVLITKISRGSGNTYSRQFLEYEWHVIGTSTSGEPPLQHEQLATYKLDLSQPNQIQAFIKQLEAEDAKRNLSQRKNGASSAS